MSLVLRAPRPLPLRSLVVALLALASAVSLAPTALRVAAIASHAAVCHCAHCPGGASCCCAVHPAGCLERS